MTVDTRERPIAVYLAGPAVFHPDRTEIMADQTEICQSAGLTPVTPADGEPVDPAQITVERIYASNVDRIRRADLVIADMTHFRGSEPDSGTCFEVGFAVALGTPCYLYCEDGATTADRVRQFHGTVHEDAPGGPVDEQGRTIEDFGFPVNLMMCVPCTVVTGNFQAAVNRVRQDVSEGRLVLS